MTTSEKQEVTAGWLQRHDLVTAFRHDRSIGRYWQVQLHRRAASELAMDLHIAVNCLRETIDLTEPELRSFADLLSREERIERLRYTAGVVPAPLSLTAIMT